MLRALSMGGLGGLFLMISPKLRISVQEAIGTVYSSVQFYAPLSYIGLGVLLIVWVLSSFYRGAQPR